MKVQPKINIIKPLTIPFYQAMFLDNESQHVYDTSCGPSLRNLDTRKLVFPDGVELNGNKHGIEYR